MNKKSMGAYMKKILLVLLIFVTPTIYAECIGSGNFKTCYDDSGNTYDVSKFGNTTYVDGYNSSTGSSWEQTSTTFGNSTYTDGYDKDGNSWESTTTTFSDGSTMTIGTDSDGNSFSSSCDSYGNCY